MLLFFITLLLSLPPTGVLYPGHISSLGANRETVCLQMKISKLKLQGNWRGWNWNGEQRFSGKKTHGE
jgi:hypothetical protein